MKKQNEISVMEWIAWAWIGILLLLGATTNGIFKGIGIHSGSVLLVYEPPILYSLFLSAAVLIWIGFHIYQKQFQLEKRMIIAIAAFLLFLVYVASHFYAESQFLSLYGILVSLLTVIFFIAGTFLYQYERIIIYFPKLYLLFGYGVVIYGLLNLLGNTYLLDSLSYFEGIRITSIFQYANAYAVLLLTIWIASLLEVIESKKRYERIVHSFMLVPVIVSFLLTLSRGALIVLPIIAIITLLLLKFRQQILMILYSGIGLVLSLLLYTHLENAGTKVYERIQQARAQQIDFQTSSIFSMPSIVSWSLLVGFAFLMAGLVYIVSKYVEPKLLKFTEKKWRDKITPLSLLALFVLGTLAMTGDWFTRMLPDVLRTRVENVSFQTHSVYERLTMYKDAFEIWKTSPLFGLGAGGWEAVYERYQSYPYISAQTHSFLTQVLVETGIIGFAVYIGFIITILVLFLRYFSKQHEAERNKTRIYFIIAITILIHSLIDFEMSYILYLSIVFLCLGIMAGTQRQQIGVKTSKGFMSRTRWIVTITLIALFFVIVISANQRLTAINKYKEADADIARGQSIQSIIETLEDGLSKVPGHPLILHQIGYIYYNAYQQTQDNHYLEQSNHYFDRLYQYEPNYRPHIEVRHMVAFNNGEDEKALEIIMDGLMRYPYDQSLYDQAVSDLLTKWNVARGSDESSAGEIEAQILELYQEMTERGRTVSELPDTINLIKRFNVTSPVRLAAAQVLYEHKKYDQVVGILEEELSEDFSNAQGLETVRYYLAAQRQLGHSDDQLFNKLIEADPSEESRLRELMGN